GLVLQPEGRPARRAAGRGHEARLPGARAQRRREGGLVGAGGQGLARLCDVPDEDEAPDPRVRPRDPRTGPTVTTKGDDAGPDTWKVRFMTLGPAYCKPGPMVIAQWS